MIMKLRYLLILMGRRFTSFTLRMKFPLTNLMINQFNMTNLCLGIMQGIWDGIMKFGGFANWKKICCLLFPMMQLFDFGLLKDEKCLSVCCWTLIRNNASFLQILKPKTCKTKLSCDLFVSCKVRSTLQLVVWMELFEL